MGFGIPAVVGARDARGPAKNVADFLYATIHRGRVRVSPLQHRFLHWQHLPHTHWYRSNSGRIYGKRVYD